MKALSLSAINSSNPCLPKTHLLKVPIFHPFFKFKPFSYSHSALHGHGAKRAHTFPFTISCKLESSQDKKNKGKSVSQKIVLSGASPPPLTENDKSNVLALLGASLMACTYTTQLPLIKVSRRWSFLHSAEAIRKQEFSESLPRPSIQDVSTILMGAGYEVFLKGPSLYAFQGLAGRLAPVGVHIALLLIMAGGTLSACGSFRGSVTVPQGLNFVVYDVLAPSGFLSSPTDAFNTEIHVNKFYMDYYESGEVSQFHTDLSLRNMDGKETDWSISALQILKDNEGPYNLAMAPLQINGDKQLFGTYLPAGDINSPDVKGISMLARDLQSIVLYDKEGKFAGVTWPNSKLPINIDGSEIVIVDAIGSSGLDLKTDPGVPVVYAGFGALMITTCISYLSHSQIWALQDGTAVFIGVKTNRAKMEFPEEMNRLLDKVPEIVESSLPKQADSISG
ncbi:hypothetical protein AAZV13_12G041600 [Glycine max]